MPSEIILYNSPDGEMQIQVKLENETVWLTQQQIAILFNKSRNTIAEHIANIFKDGELEEKATCRKFRQVQMEGTRKISRELAHYNLDVIISVGYRVKSPQGVKFRQWATQRIKEYIIKGFTLDDNRLKQQGGRTRYFEELLQRIRDIRASERNFYQKVTDIYATSIDYKTNATVTQKFFATMQNKMHYAVHGQTAAEIIKQRANSDKELMGLTNFQGDYLTLQDISIAKNYLTKAELHQLNLIVTLYLDFAELQATNKRAMKMQDWIKKLDDFLKISEKKILQNAGTISNEEALKKAQNEFEKYKKEESKKEFSDFDKQIKKIRTKK